MIDESLKRLRSNSSQVGTQRWMVLIDAALAYQRSGNCGPVALVRRPDVKLNECTVPENQWPLLTDIRPLAGDRTRKVATATGKRNRARRRPRGRAAEGLHGYLAGYQRVFCPLRR